MFLPSPTPNSPRREWGMRAAALSGVVAAVVISSSTSEVREAASPVGSTGPRTDDTEQWITTMLDHHVAVRPPIPVRAAMLRSMEVRVGVPVRLPQLERLGARWVGADVVSWNSASAALLQYRVRRHRVTVYMYDSDRTPLRTLASLHPRVVSNAVVFVGERRGYSVAVVERLGLGHAVVAELSPDECAELVTAIPTH